MSPIKMGLIAGKYDLLLELIKSILELHDNTAVDTDIWSQRALDSNVSSKRSNGFSRRIIA